MHGLITRLFDISGLYEDSCPSTAHSRVLDRNRRKEMGLVLVDSNMCYLSRDVTQPDLNNVETKSYKVPVKDLDIPTQS